MREQKRVNLAWWQWVLAILVGLMTLAILSDVMQFYGPSIWIGFGRHNIDFGLSNGQWFFTLDSL